MSSGEETSCKATILHEVCDALTGGNASGAAAILRSKYPFQPVSTLRSGYSPARAVALFRRDRFVDRYSGKRLVFPGALRLISMVLPSDFPFHANWKMDACHFAFYELFPVLDHVVPLARGGEDTEGNVVTTSTVRNSVKANFLLSELGWKLRDIDEAITWDGLLGWFTKTTQDNPLLLNDANVKRWHTAVANRSAGA